MGNPYQARMNRRSARVAVAAALIAGQILVSAPLGLAGEPENLDAMEYARMFEVDLAEAERRLALQEEVAEFRLALQKSEGDVFGGLYIDHRPTFRIVAQFTGDGAAVLGRHQPPSSFAADVVVEQVDFTLAQLERDLATLVSRMGRGPYAFDIDVTRNRVTMEALSLESAERSLQGRLVELPPTARVKVVEDLPTPALSLYGGLHLSTCTSGFTMWKNVMSNRRITTAGHCGNSQSYAGNSLTYNNDEQRGAGHDEQSHGKAGATYPNKIKISTTGTTRTIDAKRTRIAQNIGDFVCHYGKNTGFGCGNIVSVTSGSCGGIASGSIGIKVDSDPDGPGFDLSEPGDSGGPWFLSTTAFGTMSCQQGFDGIYVAIDVVESGLGSKLLINP